MRGRVNLLDLFDMPFNRVHELYRYTFSIKDEKEKEREEQEKARKAEEEKQKKREEMTKHSPTFFDRRLSPAAQARENKKSQDDEKKKSEDKSRMNNENPLTGIDFEELTDMLEEGI